MLSLVVTIILFLVIIILISSVRVHLEVAKENHDNKVIIKIRMLYGLIRLKKELDQIKLTQKKEEVDGDVDEDLELEIESGSGTSTKSNTDFINVRKQIDKSMEMFKKYKSVINYLMNKINFRTLYWKTEIGFDDAALTGMSIGIVNIFKSNVYAMFNNINFKPEKIYFKVIPNFNREILKTDIHSIFKVKIGYIIIAGLKYLWITSTKK